MERDMTKGSPLPVILRFTLPLIIGNIFQQLYNMADTAASAPSSGGRTRMVSSGIRI